MQTRRHAGGVNLGEDGERRGFRVLAAAYGAPQAVLKLGRDERDGDVGARQHARGAGHERPPRGRRHSLRRLPGRAREGLSGGQRARVGPLGLRGGRAELGLARRRPRGGQRGHRGQRVQQRDNLIFSERGRMRKLHV